MISILRTSLLAAAIAICLVAGCTSKDTGQTEVKFDAAAAAQNNEAKIKEVQDNPNIPEHQKQQIIDRIRSAPAVSEGAKATGTK